MSKGHNGYLEVGTVSIGNKPAGTDTFVELLSQIVDERPETKDRLALAGPNDILHILMPSNFWELLLPWAKAVGFGAAGFVGNHFVHKFIDSKTDKKIDQTNGKIDDLTAQVEALQKSIRELESYDQTSQLDFRFGLKSTVNAEQDITRPIAGIQVSKDDPTSAADAVLALSMIGPEVETEIEKFLSGTTDSSEKRLISGFITIDQSGRVSAKLHRYSSQLGGLEPIELSFDPAKY
ncbi:MAG: hypothetical protein AAFY42_01340 [Pseudomonadota bacterium]